MGRTNHSVAPCTGVSGKHKHATEQIVGQGSGVAQRGETLQV